MTPGQTTNTESTVTYRQTRPETYNNEQQLLCKRSASMCTLTSPIWVHPLHMYTLPHSRQLGNHYDTKVLYTVLCQGKAPCVLVPV